MLRREWQKDLLILHTDRKHVGRQLPVDRAATLRLLQHRPLAEQLLLLLLREICGGFQTKRQQHAWDTNAADRCEWCQMEGDTREHRLFHPFSKPFVLAARANFINFCASTKYFTRVFHGQEKMGRHSGRMSKPSPEVEKSMSGECPSH